MPSSAMRAKSGHPSFNRRRAARASQPSVPRILIYHSHAIYSVSKVEYYTPVGPDASAAGGKRFVPNRLDRDSVMARVSRDLYASPTAGVREILANEITAARAAKREGADPRIEVTLLEDRIVVWGIESLGMERRIFDDIYMVLGRSGNFDGTTPGQFGLGRAAYVTVSDHILLETHHRNGDKYVALGVEGRGFQVDMGVPDIPFGTRITLVPRDASCMSAIESTVRYVAGRCEIPITLTTEDGTETLGWRPLTTSHPFLNTDLPDAEFSVGLGRSGDRGYLCGMPIGFTYRGRHDISVAVDIHDERKYPPTPDRERMAEDAEIAISELIDAGIADGMAGFPDDVGDAMEDPDRHLAHRLGLGPRALRSTVKSYNSYGSEWVELGSLYGSPVLACHAFTKRHIQAVLERYPRAEFVRYAPAGITTMLDFMRRRGIAPPPVRRVTRPKTVPRDPNAGKVPARSSYGEVMLDPEAGSQYRTVYRVDGEDDLERYKHVLECDDSPVITVHDVRGAIDLREMEAAARADSFTTSRGRMSGAELLDSDADIHRVSSRPLMEMWGDGAMGRGDILVLDEGKEFIKPFKRLRVLGRSVRNHVSIMGWRCEAALEAYLRLESPILRDAMLKCYDLRNAKYRSDLLAADGKPPVECGGSGCGCRHGSG